MDQRRQCRVLTVGATGEVLCFIDADSRLHPETLNVIGNAVDTGRFIAGATGVRMERCLLGIAVTCALQAPMVR